MLLLDQIAQISNQQRAGLLSFQTLQIALQRIVGGRLVFQVVFNFGQLFVDDVVQCFQTLLDRKFGQIPLKTGQVGGQVHSVGLQVFIDAAGLVFQNVHQICGQLVTDAFNVCVHLAQLVRKSDQLIQRADFQIGNMKFEILAQIVLFAGHIVQRLPRLLASLLARSTD